MSTYSFIIVSLIICAAISAAYQAIRRRQDLNGVSGWLWVLCVLLTVVSPIGALYSAWYDETAGFDVQCFAVFVAGTSLIIGLSLWFKARYAPLAAKIWIGLWGGLSVLVLAKDGYTADFAQMLIATIGWLAYLQFSRRVKTTYQL